MTVGEPRHRNRLNAEIAGASGKAEASACGHANALVNFYKLFRIHTKNLNGLIEEEKEPLKEDPIFCLIKLPKARFGLSSPSHNLLK
jgi:hypothetical protein